MKYLLFISLLFSPVFLLAQELGIATFANDIFHGRKTSSGAIYDKYKLTASHRTLPYGTKVRVRNLQNKKIVEVEIIDRGPFISGRIIELSRAAAEKIDLTKTGEAKVSIEIVKAPIARNAHKKAKPSNKALGKATNGLEIIKEAKGMQEEGLYKMQVLELQPKGYAVQVASYKEYQAVVNHLTVLQNSWIRNSMVVVEKKNKTIIYKVVLGPFPTKEAAIKY